MDDWEKGTDRWKKRIKLERRESERKIQKVGKEWWIIGGTQKQANEKKKSGRETVVTECFKRSVYVRELTKAEKQQRRVHTEKRLW